MVINGKPFIYVAKLGMRGSLKLKMYKATGKVMGEWPLGVRVRVAEELPRVVPMPGMYAVIQRTVGRVEERVTVPPGAI